VFALITNTPRDYAWGSPTALAELLGRAPSGGPEAELWLGTHPLSPARLAEGGGSLAQAAGELPFLLKLLAADAPLSLQAHPDPAQARAGFEREEAAGIPLDAPERNYKDRSAKPELLYALSDEFRALSGFRSVAETRLVLGGLVDDPRVAPLAARLETDADLGPAVAWLLGGGPEVAALVDALSLAARGLAGPSWDTVGLLAAHYPGDPGIAISLLLHTVVLRRGDALYLPAGNLHAYLGGVGIELMAPSDNVLRGGLTPKHVDVPELLAVLDARPLPAPLLPPAELEPGLRAFAPEGAGFRLFVAEGSALARGVAIPVGGPAIAIALGGDVEISGNALPAGSAAYLELGSAVRARGSGLLAVATAA